MPKIDLEALTKMAAAMFFLSIMGVLAAFAFGFYMVCVLFEVFFGY